MMCYLVKGKTVEELSSNIKEYINRHQDCEVHTFNYNKPTSQSEFYSCLLLLIKEDEEK